MIVRCSGDENQERRCHRHLCKLEPDPYTAKVPSLGVATSLSNWIGNWRSYWSEAIADRCTCSAPAIPMVVMPVCEVHASDAAGNDR